MQYTEAQLAVLTKFNVIDEKGAWVNVDLIRPEDKPLGPGPKVEPEVIKKFLTLDTTEGQVWFEWLLHQAAGGDRARESSMRAMEQMQQRFIDERVHGFQHAKTKEVFPPVPRENAERQWQDAKLSFEEVLVTGDQDVVEKLGVWGFYRSWPGNQGIYQKVHDVFTTWLATQAQLRVMNKELERDSKEPLPLTPSTVTDIEHMESLCKKVTRYFASKEARDDIRLAVHRGQPWIYNDDKVIVVAPLTYAASVRHGSDSWLFSNREAFERLLLDENNFTDNWGTPIQKGTHWAFIRFKTPMPRWVARRNSQFFVHELTNLAVELNAKGPTGTLIDEEGQTRSVDQVVDMILFECTRPEDPTDAEMPVKRGPNAYTSRAEADQIVAALNRAVDEIKAWHKVFDPATIKAKPLDYLTKATPSAE